jgi:hypothetical protein
VERGVIEGFTTERGDVLLSLQLILAREADEPRASREPAAPVPPVRPIRLVEAPREIEERRPALDPAERRGPVETAAAAPQVPPAAAAAPAPATASRPLLRPVPQVPSPVGVVIDGPATWTGAHDPATGAPGVSAMRRDLVLEAAWPTGHVPRSAVIVWTMETVEPRRIGRMQAERLLRSMIEAVGSGIGPKDRAYRTGPCELSLLVRGLEVRTADGVARSIHDRLAAATASSAGGLRPRSEILDPADAVRRLSRVHWTAAEGGEPNALARGLAPAI